MEELLKLFEDLDCDTICVSDLGIHFQGARIDYILCDYDRKIEFWSGNPFTDKDAEQLMLDETEVNFVSELIAENF